MSSILVGCEIALATSVALLVWTWFAYPALVIAASRFRPQRSVATPSEWPSVSAVLATREDSETVRTRVQNLLASDYPHDRLDVIVAVDRSVTAESRLSLLGLSEDRVKVIDGEIAGGKAANLNAGVREATGDIVVFADSHQSFDDDAVRVLVSTLCADPSVAIAGGGLFLPGDRTLGSRTLVEWYWTAERKLREAEAILHSTVGVSGAIYAMRRSLWMPLRTGLILDDVYVPMVQIMKGHKVAYTLKARAWDTRRTTPSQERTRKVRTLTGNFQLVAWLPAIAAPIRNPVWIQFVSHKVLRLVTPWLLATTALSGTTLILARTPAADLGSAAIVLAALLCIVALTKSLRRKLLRATEWFVTLNSALIQASANGFRGKWDVW